MASKKDDNVENKGKSKNIFVIIVFFIFLGVGAFGGTYFYLSKKNASAMEEKKIKEAYYDLGEIMVKLGDTDSKRYLKCKVAISYDSSNKNIATELEEDNVAIRDATIYYFMSKKAKDFDHANEKGLKDGLIARVNPLLSEGQIINVRFSELITQ